MGKKRARVIYLTWGETPRSYGVFGSQVVNMLNCIERESNVSLYLVSGVPVINSGMIREKWRYWKELKKIKTTLRKISFNWVFIFCPQNFFNSSKNMFSFMHGASHIGLHRIFRKIEPDIVHCRSYHAAWAAKCLREKYFYTYSIIFDGRDMWPEEVALKKGYSDTSKDYLFLKKIEKELLVKSDISIGVSEGMCKHYEELGATRVERVYLSADTAKLANSRYQNKYPINAESDVVKFCYVGALSESSWHKVTELHALYSLLRKMFVKTHLTIVTTSDQLAIERVFSDVPKLEITITKTETVEQLASLLREQHIGLMAYFKPSNDMEIALGKILLAIKTVEYLSAGLPIITNRYCGGASHILETNKLGISYCPEQRVLVKDSIEDLLNEEIARRCLLFARKNFDFSSNALRYAELYSNLEQKKSESIA